MPPTPDAEQPQQHPEPAPVLEGPHTDEDALDDALYWPHTNDTPRTYR